MMAHHSNRPYRVKLTIAPTKANVDLIVLFTTAGLLENIPGVPNRYYLHPPKGTTDNQWWAEHVYEHCKNLFAMEVVVMGGTATR